MVEPRLIESFWKHFKFIWKPLRKLIWRTQFNLKLREPTIPSSVHSNTCRCLHFELQFNCSMNTKQILNNKDGQSEKWADWKCTFRWTGVFVETALWFYVRGREIKPERASRFKGPLKWSLFRLWSLESKKSLNLDRRPKAEPNSLG